LAVWGSCAIDPGADPAAGPGAGAATGDRTDEPASRAGAAQPAGFRTARRLSHTPSRTSGAGAARPAGFGATRLRTPSGIRTVRYEVIDGHAIYGGDVDLGPLEALPDPRLRGGAVVQAGDLWPNHYVRYYIDPSLSTTTPDTIESAIQDLRTHTPVELGEIASPNGNYIRFLYGPSDAY